MNKICLLFSYFMLLLLSKTAFAQNREAVLEKLGRFSLSGYGAMNYYNFNWQTDTTKRNAIDNERFILGLGYEWTDRIKLNTEIEFEHGGTGSSVEFDRFEEFGEFEFDISKGGEVLIEQMNLEFLSKNKNTALKVGRVKVPFSLMFSRDEPTDYLTAVNSEAETQMLPENWTENGLSLSGNLNKKKKIRYHLALVNGLDGSAFNSANWIKRGNQRRFEMVNAENFALVARLDYQANDFFLIGISGYAGNTTDNRPKPDLRLQTPLFLWETHFNYKKNLFRLSGMAFYGTLGNSEALSNQNRNLSNLLNVKRTPVGASALFAFVEAGISILGKNGVLKKTNASDVLAYARYDYYDTMYSTQGIIFNNPRWQRKTLSFGTVYKIIDEVQFKAQYSLRNVGAPAPINPTGGTSENSFIAGFAFEF